MVDDQGQPLKLFAFGGNAHGVIAIGGAARGVVAIGGGVAIGVVALGVNAVGTVFACGVNAVAPITIALANGGGVLAFVAVNGFGGFGGAGVNSGFTPALALVFGVILAVVAIALPRPPPLRDARETIPFGDLVGGGAERGWVVAKLDGLAPEGLALRVGGRRVVFAASDAARALAGDARRGTRVFADLAAENRVEPVEGDYRAAPHEERVIRCEGLEISRQELRMSSVFRWSLVASAVGAFAAGIGGLVVH